MYRPQNILALPELSVDRYPLVEKLRAFLEEGFSKRIAGLYEAGEFPGEFAKGLGGLGVLEQVLTGDDPVLEGQIFRELERVDSGLRSFVSVQCALAGNAISSYGSSEQKKRWLPGLISGESIGSFALTEPQGGSDPANMLTIVTEKSGKLLLGGHKFWVTNGTLADVMVVWAKFKGKIQGLLVSARAPGVVVKPIENKLSLRVSKSAEVVFQDVEVAESDFLPGASSLGKALACLNRARLGISWGVLGAMEDCIEAAVEFSKSRILFEKPLASFQLTQDKIYQMVRGLSSAQLLAVQLTKLKTAGELQPYQVSLGKQNNVEAALQAARSAREIMGGIGVLAESKVMRHACNLETVKTYEGTSEIHKLVVGMKITGSNAFK